MSAVESRKRRLETRSVQLGMKQWQWLEGKSERSYSGSVAAELRMLVANAMEQEAREQRDTEAGK